MQTSNRVDWNLRDNADNLRTVRGSCGGDFRKCGGVRDNLAVRGYADAHSAPSGSESPTYYADNHGNINRRKSTAPAAKRGNTRDNNTRRRIVNIVDYTDKVKPQADNEQLKNCGLPFMEEVREFFQKST